MTTTVSSVARTPATTTRRTDGVLRRCWDSLGAPAWGRRVPGTMTVAAVAAVVGLVCSWFVVRSGFNLAYADAQSHLIIARRLFDSRSPGFQQLGTVWLPVPHLMLLPFVRSLWLWHTGWAAALLGTLCLTGTTCATYRVCVRLGFGRAGRLTAVGVLLANPSVLYLHTTALTEPVLLLGLAGAFAGLARWVTSPRPVSGGELAVFAGVPTAVAVLSRYEGWALVAGGVVFIAVVSLRRGRGLAAAARTSFAFAAVPATGIVWWLAYNWAIYGDPLEFMFGQYSAHAQQAHIAASGLLPTSGNLGLTLWTLNWSLYETAGLVTLVLAAVGACALAWTGGWSDRNLLVGLTTVAYVFSVVSLFLGQTVINNDRSLPQGQWNNRFAVSAMIPLAVLAAAAVHHLRGRAPRGTHRRRRAIERGWLVAVGVTAALVAQNLWWAEDLEARSAVVAEGLSQFRSMANSRAAAVWLGEHYDGGSILIDESGGGNGVLPLAGLPIVEYVNRSSGDLFDAALDRPAAYARWVFVNVEDLTGSATADDATSAQPASGDLVAEAVAASPTFFAQYELVFDTPTHHVYRRIAG